MWNLTIVGPYIGPQHKQNEVQPPKSHPPEMIENLKKTYKYQNLKAMAWYWSVVRETGGMKAVELERKYSSPTRTNPSCIWFKYRNGLSAPRDGIRKNGKQHLVHQVANDYPKTLVCWSSPLWKLLDLNPVEMAFIRQAYEWLPDDLKREVLFDTDKKSRARNFWRKHQAATDLDREFLQRAANRKDIYGITAIVTLLREAETLQMKDSFVQYLDEAKKQITLQFEEVFIGVQKPKGHEKLLMEMLMSLERLTQ